MFIVVIKTLTNSSKYLSKFTEWIDEVVENGGQVLDNVLGKGLYGGKILSESDIDDWAKLLKKKFGTELKKVESFEDSTVLAQFDANKNTILYKEDITEYFMAHESYHAEEMKLIGFDVYVKGGALKNTDIEDYTDENWIKMYKREKYVYDRIIQESKKHGLNPDEIRHNFFNIEYYSIVLEKRKIKIPL